VDPVLEMSTLGYMNGKNESQPTLLFENIKGYQGTAKVLFNPSQQHRQAVAGYAAKPGRTPMSWWSTLRIGFPLKSRQ
jgi:3-polyprenyl-4-hydroxybenzoate decarboxylase